MIKGVFLFLWFFLEALKEKKLDYSTGNFNLTPFQPHFLIIYSNHRKNPLSPVKWFSKLETVFLSNPTALQHINDMANQTLLKFNNDQQLELTKQPVTLVL